MRWIERWCVLVHLGSFINICTFAFVWLPIQKPFGWATKVQFGAQNVDFPGVCWLRQRNMKTLSISADCWFFPVLSGGSLLLPATALPRSSPLAVQDGRCSSLSPWWCPMTLWSWSCRNGPGPKGKKLLCRLDLPSFAFGVGDKMRQIYVVSRSQVWKVIPSQKRP